MLMSLCDWLVTPIWGLALEVSSSQISVCCVPKVSLVMSQGQIYAVDACCLELTGVVTSNMPPSPWKRFTVYMPFPWAAGACKTIKMPECTGFPWTFIMLKVKRKKASLPNARPWVSPVWSPSFIEVFVKISSWPLPTESPNIILCDLRRMQIQTSLFPVSTPETCAQVLLFTNSRQHHVPVMYMDWCWRLTDLQSRPDFLSQFRFSQNAPVSGECVHQRAEALTIFKGRTQFKTEYKQMCLPSMILPPWGICTASMPRKEAHPDTDY